MGAFARLLERFAGRRAELARVRGQQAVGGERREDGAQAHPVASSLDLGGPARRSRSLACTRPNVQHDDGPPPVGIGSHRLEGLRRDVELFVLRHRIALDVATYAHWSGRAQLRRFLRHGGDGVRQSRAAQLRPDDGGRMVPALFRPEWEDFVDEVLGVDLGRGSSHAR